MKDSDKLSQVLAAQYLGISPETLHGLMVAGWIEAVDRAPGMMPIFLGKDLVRLKANAPKEDPVQAKIRLRRDEIQKVLDTANKQMKSLIESCKHPNATKINKSNTGNWDRSQDSYWRECKCPDCGAYWSENQ